MTQDPPPLPHAEFRAAFDAGRVIVHLDPAAAGRFLSARLLLPLFMLPVLGSGVGLALLGWIWTGLAVIALGIITPRLIKRGAPRFLAQQLLVDEALYRDLLRAGVLQLEFHEPA